jgi:thiamine pyrophosphokinase
VENAQSKTALIIAGGESVERSMLARLDSPTWVVAADSGLDQANELGIRPDLVIGDMDSVTPAALAAAESTGIAIKRHPVDKDATDLELAIDAATDRGFDAAIIIGGTGGRMAHTLANLLLLTRKRRIRLEWITSHALVAALFAGEIGTYPAEDGALISILAVGDAAICTSSGLRWPLEGHPLDPGTTRGISNEIVATAATVTVVEGQVLIIHETS